VHVLLHHPCARVLGHPPQKLRHRVQVVHQHAAFALVELALLQDPDVLGARALRGGHLPLRAERSSDALELFGPAPRVGLVRVGLRHEGCHRDPGARAVVAQRERQLVLVIQQPVASEVVHRRLPAAVAPVLGHAFERHAFRLVPAEHQIPRARLGARAGLRVAVLAVVALPAAVRAQVLLDLAVAHAQDLWARMADEQVRRICCLFLGRGVGDPVRVALLPARRAGGGAGRPGVGGRFRAPAHRRGAHVALRARAARRACAGGRLVRKRHHRRGAHVALGARAARRACAGVGRHRARQ
jgi:hypothetical protein